MTDITSQTEAALAAIAAATSLDALEAERLEALGKKGWVSLALKTLGGMTPEERTAAAPAIQSARASIAEARKAGGAIGRALTPSGALILAEGHAQAAEIAFGLAMRAYEFSAHKTGDKKETGPVTLMVANPEAVAAASAAGRIPDPTSTVICSSAGPLTGERNSSAGAVPPSASK